MRCGCFVVLIFLIIGVYCDTISEGEFRFTLKEPLHDRVHRKDAAHYAEPGWTIEDSENRDIDISVNIPLAMRRQIPGTYEILYKAFEIGSYVPLAERKRLCTIYDINECEEGTHNCSSNAKCTYIESGGYKCECDPGYRGDGRKCNDINECEEEIASCDLHAKCINTPGSYECECKAGFEKRAHTCLDIDECTLGTHDCSPFAECKNIPGRFQCKCREGYEGTGKLCTPINICETGNNDCHHYADCIISEQNEFSCKCKSGFRGDGTTSCDDIDECAEEISNCPLHSRCRNTLGSYDCSCEAGFQLIDGNCEDIDECETGNICPRNSNCYNTIGSYKCVCAEGFEMTEDGRCQDFSGIPQLVLSGDNPMRLKLYETFSEPGFSVQDENEDVSFVVTVPLQIHGECRECGIFEVIYKAVDPKTEREVIVKRKVIVEEIDVCALPADHPHVHQCSPQAKCVFLRGMCDYSCVCPPGYFGDGIGSEGCKDAIPPIILYDGPEVYVKDICRVCGTDITEPDLEIPVITRAVDEQASGMLDLSSRIVLETEPSPQKDCLLHHYFVVDDSGNKASRTITVCLRVEDMRNTILELQQQLQFHIWAFRISIAIIVIVFIWEFGFRERNHEEQIRYSAPRNSSSSKLYLPPGGS